MHISKGTSHIFETPNPFNQSRAYSLVASSQYDEAAAVLEMAAQVKACHTRSLALAESSSQHTTNFISVFAHTLFAASGVSRASLGRRTRENKVLLLLMAATAIVVFFCSCSDFDDSDDFNHADPSSLVWTLPLKKLGGKLCQTSRAFTQTCRLLPLAYVTPTCDIIAGFWF